MKVHTLDIDSSERDTSVYPNANSYVIHLKNPIYDVSEISLVSARIATPQLITCGTNKTFGVNGNVFSLGETNYTNGTELASDLETLLAPPDSNISSVVFDTDTNALTFSNVGTSNTFTFEFYDGINGYSSNTSPTTTPHQVLGLSSNNHSSIGASLTTGAVNISGPNSIILKISSGSDEFTKTVYSSTPFYTGHILLNGSDFINISGIDDSIIHRFHTGVQNIVRDIKVEFFYTSHGRLIPYDFRNQDHIMKFNITCSTDKLEGTAKVSVPEVEKKEVTHISVPTFETAYEWKEYIYIMIIVLVGTLVLTLMKRKPN